MITKCYTLFVFLLLCSCGNGLDSSGDSEEGEEVSGESPEGSTEYFPDGTCLTDHDCSNGISCDGNEKCVDGECAAGEAPVCEDYNPCTVSYCSEDEGGCVHEPIDEDHDGYAARELPDGTSCMGVDCNDNDPSIHPDAQRDCFGDGDFNCNGVEDRLEDYEKLGTDLRLTNAIMNSLNPSLAWTGTEFGAVWWDDRDGNDEIYFSRLAGNGAKIGEDARITNFGNSYYPSLVWTGTEYFVAWSDERDGNHEIYFARISDAGTKLGNDIRITNEPHMSNEPSVAWTGTEFGVVWSDERDGNYEIYFSRVSSDGTIVGIDDRLTNASWGSMAPSIAWTGTEFGVTWADFRDFHLEIYFTRISESGMKIGGDERITESDAQDPFSPSIVWADTEFGVTWVDRRDGNAEIYFAIISPTGEKQIGDKRISNASGDSLYPSLAWTGTEYGLVWHDEKDWDLEIYFARISSVGEKTGSDIRVTRFSGDSEYPFIVWAGTYFGVAWQDDVDGNYEVYFTLVGCE